MTGLTILAGAVLQIAPTVTDNADSFTIASGWSFNDADRFEFAAPDNRWDFSEYEIRDSELDGVRSRFNSQPSILAADSIGWSIVVEADDTAAPLARGWRLIAGFDNERIEFSPGAAASTLVYRGGTVSVADGYAGIGRNFGPDGIVTFGYVRQQRSASTGAREWSDDSSFVGMTYQLSW